MSVESLCFLDLQIADIALCLVYLAFCTKAVEQGKVTVRPSAMSCPRTRVGPKVGLSILRKLEIGARLVFRW